METFNYINYHNHNYSLLEFAKANDISYSTVKYRYKKFGDNAEMILKEPNLSNPKYLIEYQGKEISLTELALKTGVSYGGLLYRYKKGLRGDELVDPNVRSEREQVKTEINGKNLTLLEISKLYGIKLSTIRDRYYVEGSRDNELIRKASHHDTKRAKISIKIGEHEYTISEICKKYNVKPSTVYWRYAKRGLRGLDVVNGPI